MLKRLGIIFTCFALAACALAGSAGAKSNSTTSTSTGATLSFNHSGNAPVARAASRKRKPRHAKRARAAAVPGTVRSHVATWAYDDCSDGGSTANASLVRQWVSYAESNCGPKDTKALSDCQADGTTYCTPVEYLDANWIYSTGSVPVAADAKDNWWLHQSGHSDSDHRISTPNYGGGHVLDQSNSAVRDWFKGYVQSNYNAYPALMMDDTGASLRGGLYYGNQTSSQELTSDGQLQAAHEQMADAMTHSDGTPFLQIDNGIGPNPWLAMPFSMLNHPSSVNGLVAEGAPMSDGTLTPYYSTLLDQMAYVDQRANDFIALLSYDKSGSPDARRLQAATVLLGYSPGHTVSWSDLETNSQNLGVWPEQGIYPTDAVQTMSAPGGSGCLAGQGSVCSKGGHNQLQVAPGVYRREFRACYNHGAAVGACASIVNTTGAPITVKSSWLTQSYGHQITFNGGDVQSGGSVNLTGAPFAAGSTTVASHDAALISQ